MPVPCDNCGQHHHPDGPCIAPPGGHPHCQLCHTEHSGPCMCQVCETPHYANEPCAGVPSPGKRHCEKCDAWHHPAGECPADMPPISSLRLVPMTATQVSERQFDCKGDWTLGTACGKCTRCTAGAPNVIAALLATIEAQKAEMAKAAEKLIRLSCVVYRAPPIADISDGLKAKIFDEVRAILYSPKG